MTPTSPIVLAAGGAVAAVAFLAAWALAEREPDYEALAREQAARDLAVNRAYAADNPPAADLDPAPLDARTVVSIDGDAFRINGAYTYPRRTWRGRRIEGLLLNARMVQGVFDDLNPQTRNDWAYPDTGVWDADRNTRDFVAAMPSWRDTGLLAVSVNLQGGNAHNDDEVWLNTAFAPDGALYPAYFDRLRSIIEEADRLGMAVILGLFYFRHDEALEDVAAVEAAVDNTIGWLHDLGARNVLIEINNECDLDYDHENLTCEGVVDLIDRVRAAERDGHRFPVTTSLQGATIPTDAILVRSDYVLLHGNAVYESEGIADMVERVRASPAWTGGPIVFNEDDNHELDELTNNFTVAVSNYASWGFYDRRWEDEAFEEGLQSVPVDWRINTDRKRAFFDLVREITGGADADR